MQQHDLPSDVETEGGESPQAPRALNVSKDRRRILAALIGAVPVILTASAGKALGNDFSWLGGKKKKRERRRWDDDDDDEEEEDTNLASSYEYGIDD